MQYWLTTHYPPLSDGSEKYPLRVWLQDGKESAGAALQKGDRVFIYEGKIGPSRYVAGSSGIKREVASSIGRQGIIALAEATGPFNKDSSFEVFQYGDGKTRWWCWHAPLSLRSNGYVPLSEVNRVLGYCPNSVLRGFGTKSSGLKELNYNQYAELERLFSANSK